MSRDSTLSPHTQTEFSRIKQLTQIHSHFSLLSLPLHAPLSSLQTSSSSSAAAMQFSPPSLRNGETTPTPSPRPRIQAAAAAHSPPPPPHHHFHSTVSVQKLRRFNTLILLLRSAAFCSAATSCIFMLVNPRGPNSPRWYDFDAFRFVLAANAIVAVYSLFEMGVSVWEIFSGLTLLPEIIQVWFDFGHDQVFAYLLLSADSAGTELARTMKAADTCAANNAAFCVQTDISIALGFAGFLFLGLSSLLSGFRVVCFIINGSRFHL